MSLVEKLGLQFFEVCFCVGLVLLVYASIQKCVLYSFLFLLILFFCFRVIQERGSEQVTAKGKWVVITGCDTGIGYHFAFRAHALGFNVVATCLDVNGKGALELKQNGGERMHVLPLDVTSDESVEGCLKHVQRLLPETGLWALVNNAGVMGFGDVELLTMGMYRKRAEVNLFGVIRVCKAFLPYVRRSKGRVVNVTSVRGVIAFPANSAYVSSKFGAEGFSDCLRMEMKRFGVKVVLVEPGNFGRATGIISKENIERLQREIEKMIEEASEEVLTAYGPNYLHTMFDGAINSSDTSHPDVDPVMTSLTSAVVCVSPQNRYLVDGSNQLVDIDCVMARLRPFVPVTILDWLMLKVRGPPPVAVQEDHR